jgi:hypothetical protein
MITRRKFVLRGAMLVLMPAATVSSIGPALAQDAPIDSVHLYGKWLYVSVVKMEDGVEKEKPMSRSSLEFIRPDQFAQFDLLKDKFVGKKGAFKFGADGRLTMKYEGGVLGPFKYAFSDGNQKLELKGIDETFRLRRKEE